MMMIVLVPVTVVGGHLAADYIADPGSIPDPWRTIAAGTGAVIVFLAFSTLTQLIYILFVTVSLPSTRPFLARIGSFSTVGAILGTALGFRMGMHLFEESGRDSSRYGLPELLGTIGDGVTLMTLIMIGLCWPFAALLALEHVKAIRSELQLGKLAQVSPLIVLAGGNSVGINAAFFAYQLLTR